MASDLPQDLVKELSGLSLGSANACTYRLLGTYSWTRRSEICIPGYPPTLNATYETLKLQWDQLSDAPLQPEDVHIGEYYHTHYYEPLEAALRHCQPDMKLTDFHLITDRNNIRKLDELLDGPNDKFERYANFSMKIRRYGNLLVLKREEDPTKLNGVSQGVDFETKLTDPSYHSDSSHALVEVTAVINQTTLRILVRCEVDCVLRGTKTLQTSDYGTADDKPSDGATYSPYEISSTGLIVKKPKNPKTAPQLTLKDLGEIKMGSKLEDSFQSHMVGIDTIVHGLKYYQRSKRCTHDIKKSNNTCKTGRVATREYNQRFFKAISKVLSLASRIEADKTYVITRFEQSHDVDLQQIEDTRPWFASPPSPQSTLL